MESDDLPRHDEGGTEAGRQLPPDYRHGGQSHCLDGPAEVTDSDKPFFLYFAPGATHAPHHAPKEWIAKYKGQFDNGLGQSFGRRLSSAEATGRHSSRFQDQPKAKEIRAWDSFSAREQSCLPAQMETFAAMRNIPIMKSDAWSTIWSRSASSITRSSSTSLATTLECRRRRLRHGQ